MEEKVAEKQDGFKAFRDGLFTVDNKNKGYLIASRCNRCKTTFFPVRKVCTLCFQNDMLEVVRLSQRGRLHVYTTVYQSYPIFPTPYIIGYVDLDEGVRVFGQIVQCSTDKLRTGMEMEIFFDGLRLNTDGDELIANKFRPAES